MKLIYARLAAISLACCLMAGVARSANIEEILRDTQRLTVKENSVSMVWWIPKQFWEESFGANVGLPPEARNQIMAVMGNYTILALLRGNVSPDGLSSAQGRENLLRNTKLTANGTVLTPLDNTDIAPTALALLSQLRPALVQAAGDIGEGIEFVVYGAKGADGVSIVDAEEAGKVEVTFFGSNYLWRLPLGSLLPPQYDSKTNEMFPGNYLFNPYTGEKLQAK